MKTKYFTPRPEMLEKHTHYFDFEKMDFIPIENIPDKIQYFDPEELARCGILGGLTICIRARAERIYGKYCVITYDGQFGHLCVYVRPETKDNNE